MKVELRNFEASSGFNVSLRCPHCGHFGTFENVAIPDLSVLEISESNQNITSRKYLGIRACPNIKCKGHLFLIMDLQGNIIYTSPSQKIPFERDSIPDNVLDALEEAIQCHSVNCFTASAIMIRKTLEEICRDRGAEGENLKEKIKNLGTKILIPKELMDGLDDLRLLGNDAAHVEAKAFTEIGKEEIEVSIDFLKELLKAVYQYEQLLHKLRKLRDKDNKVSL